MKIKYFILLLNLIIVAILTLFFYFIYIDQRDKLVAVIKDNIKKDLLESSFIAGKYLNSNKDIYSLRPLFDRKIAKNELIKGFVLSKNDKVLFVSGDAKLSIPSGDNVKHNIYNITLKDLMEKEAYEIPIYVYDNGKKIKYNLFIFLNKEELKELFGNLKFKYLTTYMFLLIVVFVLFNYIIQKYLTNPLIELREYAKRKGFEPKKLFIKELNDIKNVLYLSFEKLNETIDNLYKLTITDHLTRLGNRQFLADKIKELIEKNHEKFCLVFVDLDNFKEINDFYGHSVGDELIIEVSESLKKFINEGEVVTRVGGDEFVLVLKGCEDEFDIKNRLNKLLKILEQKWIIREQEIMTSASIGVSIYPNDGRSFDELLKSADMAMHEAKKKGKNIFVIFNKEVKEKLNEEFIIKNQLKKALENNEFELYYQPKLDRNQKVIGAEALIRWKKDGKIISPGVFIPVAEKSGLIYQIGNWVIKECSKRVKEWEKDEFLKTVSIAFNVSVVQMRHERFLRDFKNIINTFAPETSRLEMEITESVFIEDKHRAIHLLNLIRKMGLKINLDDFGTGYSSISVLKDFHIDVLKIDKSFVDEITTDDGKIYVKTIIDMAKNLNIKTVAEGVEEEIQFKILTDLGVDYFQGYYFAKPMPKEEFENFVRKNLKAS